MLIDCISARKVILDSFIFFAKHAKIISYEDLSSAEPVSFAHQKISSYTIFITFIILTSINYLEETRSINAAH